MSIKIMFAIFFGFTVITSLVGCGDDPEEEITRLNKKLDNR